VADLNTLQPWLVPYAQYLLDVGRWYNKVYTWPPGHGALVVTSARRSRADQYRLYQKFLRGESTIPAAPPGLSLHEHGLAFDMARLGTDPFEDHLLNFLGEIWEEMGGKYGGQLGGGVDPVHYQANTLRGRGGGVSDPPRGSPYKLSTG